MKEIFWGDYTIDEAQAIEMIRHGSEEEKRFLFGKILANSKNIIKDMSYFDKEDLRRLVDHTRIGHFNRAYLLKRLCIVKNYFFDEPCIIEELRWM